MEAEDSFILGMDEWLLAKGRRRLPNYWNEEEIRQPVKEEKTQNMVRKTESD